MPAAQGCVSQAMIWEGRSLHTLTFLGGELGNPHLDPFQPGVLASGEGACWGAAPTNLVWIFLHLPKASGFGLGLLVPQHWGTSQLQHS